MSLEQLECPGCGAGKLTRNPDGTLTCPLCGNHYAAPEGVLCPACGTVNDEEADYCQECGYDLVRECPVCGARNWSEATRCQACGRPLATLETVVERMQEGMADRLDRQMREAEEIKAQEEAASQRRLEEMWVREHERQRSIAEAQAEQRRQEQALVRYVLIGAAIFILVVIVVALVLSQLGGETAPNSLPPLLTAYA